MNSSVLETPASAATALCVDLDGSLVRSDTLIDSLLVMARRKPVRLLRLPLVVLRGKAAFKAWVTDAVALDVSCLPYNRPLLNYLQQQHDAGRAIYLATGADERLAQRIAAHLGIFSGVLGSDGAVNLTAHNKLDRLRGFLKSQDFAYVGNATADLPLLAASSEPMVANPTAGLRLRLKTRGIHPAQSFVEPAQPLRALLKATRLHQWAKNLLIFLPLLLAHKAGDFPLLLRTLIAFLSFSLTASATYIVNDLLDIEADRRHPRKRLRPFAAGTLPVSAGLAISGLFLALALAGTQFLPASFSLWLLLYLAATLSYSLYLKRMPLVDVLLLSGLYTMRLITGSAATGIVISHWLAGFSIFLFLSLAFVKRFAELENLRASDKPPRNGRGYMIADLEQLRAFGTSCAFASAIVLANYISSRDVTVLYNQSGRLWLMVPLLILWLCRVWLLASRGELNEDPVVFAITDKMSLLLGVATVLVVWLAH